MFCSSKTEPGDLVNFSGSLSLLLQLEQVQLKQGNTERAGHGKAKPGLKSYDLFVFQLDVK